MTGNHNEATMKPKPARSILLLGSLTSLCLAACVAGPQSPLPAVPGTAPSGEAVEFERRDTVVRWPIQVSSPAKVGEPVTITVEAATSEDCWKADSLNLKYDEQTRVVRLFASITKQSKPQLACGQMGRWLPMSATFTPTTAGTYRIEADVFDENLRKYMVQSLDLEVSAQAPPPVRSSDPLAIPTETPYQGFTFLFKNVSRTNADTTPFDTDRKVPEVVSNGDVSASWRDEGLYGNSIPKAFVVEASWAMGLAPSSSNDRSFEIHFASPPKVGQAFSLSTGPATESSARFYYHQAYRFHHDVWAATSGTLRVGPTRGEEVGVTVDAAKMAPAPNAEQYRDAMAPQGGAKGTFEVEGGGVLLLPDAYQLAEPSP